MSCGGGCCPRKNYNSDKPLSKRIPQVVLVFAIVWLIGFGYIAQLFNQPTRKPKNKRRNKKRNNRNNGFFGKLSDELHNGNKLTWAIIIFIIVLFILLLIRVIRNQAKKLENQIQDKWEEAMAEQQRRYNARMNDYYDYNDEDEDGPRIRELETEEEEAQWRELMEKERKERERKIASENSDEEKKTK
ncbi:hypothetical protein BCR36DRAFT_586218 [Piromyces finnis]|uniref:Uncharacterized protein n=1 Tax=Piromyces finnis TaxID=1754191 RepID=A0A1Y1V1H1_9FUNG|nr:hypothetical protein BCR36DRAFT_586218 [Piromyces finnis]|eukprot:ORX44360.1 hypothetical protein BCR36DRAFT_586218 [Piromyces finnis]